jgi:hypothetical protein
VKDLDQHGGIWRKDYCLGASKIIKRHFLDFHLQKSMLLHPNTS